MAGLALSTGSLRAQLTWVGSVDGNFSNSANWTGTAITGTGNISVDISFTSTTPQTISLAGFTLDDLTFSGASRPTYTFTGNGSNKFTLTGIIQTTTSGGDIVFSSTLPVTLANDPDNNIHTVNLAANSTVKIESNIDEVIGSFGAGSFIKSGAGTFVLSGINTFSAGISLNAGTLALNSATAPGTGRLTISGGTLDNTSGSAVTLSNNNAQTWSGSFTFGGTNDLNLGAGNVTLGGNRTVTVTAGNLTVGGIIEDNSNTYGLTKAGAGTLILTGANGYDWTTTVSAGTLQIGNGGTTGSVAGNITNNSSVVFSRSNSDTYAGIISGSGTLGLQGGGNLTLTGVNTYTGATSITQGSTLIANTAGALPSATTVAVTFGNLTIGASQTIAGISGSNTGNVSIAGGRSLTINNSAGNSFGGTISGSGDLNKSGAGSLTLSGANTYSGNTTVSAGTLVANNSSASATGTGLITVASGATLQVGNGVAAGSVSGNIANSGSVVFNRSDSAAYSGSVSGTGSGTKLGAGTLSLIGTNTFTGGTTISAGTLQVGDGATNGSLTGNITNNSALSFSRSDNVTLTNNISGTGSLTVLSGGSFTLSGNNTYSGPTTISANTTLAIAQEGNLGATPGTVNASSLVINGGALQTTANLTLTSNRGVIVGGSGGTFLTDGNTTLTVAGNITGGASLIKNGAGLLVLAGTNNYGSTVINAGELQLASTGSLNSGGDITINGTGTFHTFASKTVGALSSASATSSIVIESGVTLNSNMASNTTSTFAGLMSGAGSFLKNGPGSLTLTGSSGLTGLTTVSSGTLQIGNNGTLGSITGNITIANPGTLDFNRSNAVTYSGILSGNGTLAKDGASSLTIDGAGNSFNGTLKVNAGTLSLAGVNNGTIVTANVSAGAVLDLQTNVTFNSPGSLTSSGTTQIASGKTLTFSNGSPLSSVISGAGNVAISGVVTVLADQTYTGTTTINDTGNNLTLNLGNSTTSGMVAGNIVTTTSKTGVQFNRTDAITYGGVISGGGFLNKNNTNTLTLTGQNTYAGGTSISGGTLVIGATNALPTTTGLGVQNGATLDVAQDQTITRFTSNATNSTIKIEDGKTFTVALVSSVTTNGGSGTAFYGNITDGSVPGAGGKLVIGNDSDGRTVGLFGTNTYTGGTTINSNGKLLLGNNGTTGSILGNVTNNGQLIFNRGNTTTFSGIISGNGSVSQGTLSGQTAGDVKLTANNTYTGGTNVYAKTLILGDGGTSGSIVGNVALFNNASIGFNRADNTSFGGVVSGTGSLIKASTGNLTLTGQNTYSGNTTVMTGGKLVVGAANALPATTQLAIAASAALDVNFNQTVAGFLSAGDLTSLLHIASGATFTVDMPVANTATTFAGTVDGSGTFAVSGAGGDVVNLTGTVADTVGTLVGNGATLNIASGGAVTGPVSLGTGSTLTLSNSGSQTYTNVISGSGSIVASGGTTTLAGANTFTGGVTINGGKIIVSNTSGSATGTGPVVVGSGGVLGGSGIITGPLTLNNGAIVSPGNSPGMLTVGATTFSSGATFAFDINDASGSAGTNWDILRVTGPLTVSATTASPFIINLVSLDFGNSSGLLSNFDPMQAYSWQFVSTTGGINGFSAAAFQYNASQFQNGLNGGTFSVAQLGNNLVLNFTPIPEPSTWALLLSGLGALAFAALRRRKA